MAYKLWLDPAGHTRNVADPDSEPVVHTYRVTHLPPGDVARVVRVSRLSPMWSAEWRNDQMKDYIALAETESDTAEGSLALLEEWINNPQGRAATRQH